VRDTEFAEYAGGRWATLVRTAVLLGARPHEAEDLAQRTLLRCYLSWAKVQRADHRDAYVARIMLNELRSERRRRWSGEVATSRLPDEPVDDHADEVVDAVAGATAVRRSLGRLGAEQREALVLRYYLHLTEAQIADAQRVAPGTVKSRISRALKALAADRELLALEEE
jgi:RNA polymerase sigma-70 factor (sigma-E family)